MQVHWEGKSFLVRYRLSGLDEELPGRPAMLIARLLFGDHDGTEYEPFFSFLFCLCSTLLFLFCLDMFSLLTAELSGASSRCSHCRYQSGTAMQVHGGWAAGDSAQRGPYDRK